MSITCLRKPLLCCKHNLNNAIQYWSQYIGACSSLMRCRLILNCTGQMYWTQRTARTSGKGELKCPVCLRRLVKIGWVAGRGVDNGRVVWQKLAFATVSPQSPCHGDAWAWLDGAWGEAAGEFTYCKVLAFESSFTFYARLSHLCRYLQSKIS